MTIGIQELRVEVNKLQRRVEQLEKQNTPTERERSRTVLSDTTKYPEGIEAFKDIDTRRIYGRGDFNGEDYQSWCGYNLDPRKCNKPSLIWSVSNGKGETFTAKTEAVDLNTTTPFVIDGFDTDGLNLVFYTQSGYRNVVEDLRKPVPVFHLQCEDGICNNPEQLIYAATDQHTVEWCEAKRIASIPGNEALFLKESAAQSYVDFNRPKYSEADINKFKEEWQRQMRDAMTECGFADWKIKQVFNSLALNTSTDDNNK